MTKGEWFTANRFAVRVHPTMGPIAEAAFAAMMVLAPPDRLAALPQYRGHEESVEERRSRYVAIAIDLEDAVAEAEPLPGMSRARTAAVALGIAYMESGFARDADVGPCVAGPGRCDRGRAACLMQVQAPEHRRAELWADRKLCFMAGLDVARRSMNACRGELTAYVGGVCTSLVGRAAGRRRLGMGQRIYSRWFAP